MTNNLRAAEDQQPTALQPRNRKGPQSRGLPGDFTWREMAWHHSWDRPLYQQILCRFSVCVCVNILCAISTYIYMYTYLYIYSHSMCIYGTSVYVCVLYICRPCLALATAGWRLGPHWVWNLACLADDCIYNAGHGWANAAGKAFQSFLYRKVISPRPTLL